MATWNDVKNAIHYWSASDTWGRDLNGQPVLGEFGDSEKEWIEKTLKEFYENSDIARNWLDILTVPGTVGLRIGSSPRNEVTENRTVVGFSQNTVGWMINQYGTLTEYKAEYQLLHEVLHVAMHVGDSSHPDPLIQNGASYQFIATNLAEEKNIAIQMGDGDQVPTNYLTRFTPADASTYLGWGAGSLGENFTAGQSIKYSRLGTEVDDFMTMEPRDSTDPSDDLMFGLEGHDELRGASGNDHLYGDFSRDFLVAGDDRLYGGSGDDHLYGGGGNDTFFADPGDDHIWGGWAEGASGAADGLDVVDYSAGTAGITITFDGENGAALTVSDGTGGTDYLYSIERIIGSAGSDYLRYTGTIPTGYNLRIDAGLDSGDTVASAFYGTSNITLTINDLGTGYLQSGDDENARIYFDNFKTQIIGTTFDDEITDFAIHEGEKRINGGSGDDVITVDGSDAMIQGGQGNDIIHGGDGNDIIVGSAFALYEADQLFGGDGSDFIVSKSALDMVDGGDGHDYVEAVTGTTVRGGGGNDVIDFGHTSGNIVFGANDGNDLVIASDPSNNNDDVDIFLEGLSKGDVTIVVQDEPGSRCSVAIVVNATGASLLLREVPGDANHAVLQLTFEFGGKLGRDFPWEDLTVVEGSISQYDVALADYQAAIAATPGANSGGSGNDDMRGSRSDDTISGGGGDDSFRSSGGSDTIDGGSGNDVLRLFGSRYDFQITRDAATGDITFEDMTGLEGKVTVKSVEQVYFTTDNQYHAPGSLITINGTPNDDPLLQGDANDNMIFGLAGADLLRGLGGSDLLDGGEGADQLEGGDGDDFYYVDNAGDVIVETATGGTDIVYASAGYTLNAGAWVELLTTTSIASTYAVDMTGNDLNNTIWGNNGNNTLSGGIGGQDTLVGFLGDDIYLVNNITEVIVENAGEGTDIVYVNSSYTLSAFASIELLSTYSIAGTENYDMTGNNLSNTIWGNRGNNTLSGGIGGTDTLVGFLGDDIYLVNNGNEFISELANEGTDIVYAGVSYVLSAGASVELMSTTGIGDTNAINLTGNELVNTIWGNNGANVLNGGLGADTLSGFGGADTFAFTTALGGGNVDVIADFSAVDDTIQLDDAIFAGIGTPGAFNAAAFASGTAAADADDRIIYNQATGQLLYDADGNGAGAAVLFATISGNPALTASDFAVI